ncbi:MAG: hypothetical protein BWY97_00521 [Tenericutes bacterium ADurb.BinA124]|nr:MAG: hypothetical protein BWY97_00521 [Tenericutes bacterium ADurb.BinA124]
MKKIILVLIIVAVIGPILVACRDEDDASINITWVNYDDEVLQIDRDVEPGTLPEYKGETPKRGSDDGFTYVFRGWEPEVVEATKSTVYKAIYQKMDEYYNVTWKDENGTVLRVDENIPYGETLTGPTPTKESNEIYDYTFMGWSPAVTPVTSNATYTATFAATVRKYKVTWVDTAVYNPATGSYRTVIYEEQVDAGTTPVYKGSELVKQDTEYEKYLFEGWSPAPSRLVKDMTFSTRYVEAYDVSWYNWYNDEELIKTIRLKKPNDWSDEYDPEYEDLAPTIPDDAGYTYKFKGWFRLESPWWNDNRREMAEREYIATYDCISKDDRYDPRKFERYYGANAALPTCRINDYTGDFYADFHIPTWLNGEMVTGIDMIDDDSYPGGVRGAFEDNKKIVNLYLGDNLDEFNHNIFRGCTNLQNIHFGKNMKYLGYWMFENCTSLRNVTIPEQIEVIDWGAFCGCNNLLTVTFSEGLKRIEALAFSECEKLTTITLPNSLTYVGGFDGCTSLHTVNLGEGLIGIGPSCFNGDIKLKNINYLGSSNVEHIGDYAFYKCEALTSANFPASLKSIGKGAFYDCINLHSVDFFENPSQLTTIDIHAFRNCKDLRILSIPSSVTELGRGFVAGCDKLTTLKMSADNDTYKSTSDMIIDKKKGMLVAGCNGSGAIPTKDITIIGPEAFYECKTFNAGQTLVIPNNITEIRENAFWGCIGIKYSTGEGGGYYYSDFYVVSVFIPSSVTRIDMGAFYLSNSELDHGGPARYFGIFQDYNTTGKTPGRDFSVPQYVPYSNKMIFYKYEGNPADPRGRGYGYWHDNCVLWTYEECYPKEED